MKKALIAVLFLFITGFSLEVEAKQLIPMGNSIGIELHLENIEVAQDVLMENQQWLKRGDQITLVNNKAIQSVESFSKSLQQSNQLKVVREKETIILDLEKQQAEKLVPFLTDKVEGIGTLTYVDPETEQFGALGHQIVDQHTKEAPVFSGGSLFDVQISGMKKSAPGIPGYKIAQFDYQKALGLVKQNEIYGVFGNWQNRLTSSLHEPLEIMRENDVKTGAATILTAINANKVEEFKIEIDSVDNGELQFHVVDKTLLETTGGIVQGMSGSPIIQNNQIVGAITHMYVEKPTKGVGLLILEMLEKR